MFHAVFGPPTLSRRAFRASMAMAESLRAVLLAMVSNALMYPVLSEQTLVTADFQDWGLLQGPQLRECRI